MDHNFIKDYPKLSKLAQEYGEDSFFGKLLEQRRDFTEQIEGQLCNLDEKAWQTFKSKVKSYSTRYDPLRGYSQVVDLLNEVRGYIFLKDQGYENVEFIEEGDGKNPDLHATGKSGEALMEVKTLHWSDFFVENLIKNTKRVEGLLEESANLEKLPPEVEFPEYIREKVRYNNQKLFFKGIMFEEEMDALLKLSEDESYREAVRELFDKSHIKAQSGEVDIPSLSRKLESTVKRAKEQLTSSNLAKNTTRKICYLFVMFDPFISRRHYKNELAELDKYLNNLKEGNPEI